MVQLNLCNADPVRDGHQVSALVPGVQVLITLNVSCFDSFMKLESCHGEIAKSRIRSVFGPELQFSTMELVNSFIGDDTKAKMMAMMDKPTEVIR